VDRPSDTVIVFTGGDPVVADALGDLPRDAYVIAADSGLDHARRLGWAVDVAVGDFDSATPDAVDASRADGTVVEVHPRAKDHTDFELALQRAVARHPRRIVVVGGQGGRLDHLLANALTLSGPARAGIDVDMVTGAGRLHVVSGRRRLPGRRGELITLLALHGPAGGVTTDGLAFPLADETLHPGSSRGVSNQFERTEAWVSVTDGMVLVVIPGEAGPPLTTPIQEDAT
jgi:thiamine pyrophosphokinase